MITAYVRCSDGPEGDWRFDVLPRLGEHVWLRSTVGGLYEVVRVEHYPDQPEVLDVEMERGVALRLLKIPDDMPPWPTEKN